MGQTLTHGVYLPDEGERNCYAGLAANWSILDGAVGTVAEHTTQIAGKAPAVHTHTVSDITDFPAYGTTAGTICEGNDSRLSDARTPLSHTHGNITNDGKVGTTANKPLITGTGGAVQAGSFGNSANTFCEGNDSRLSDARTPVAHTHGKADITDLFNSANEWRETNTFDKNLIFKSSFSLGNIPSSNAVNSIAFKGTDNNNSQDVRFIIDTTGETYTSFRACNKFTSGALSPGGSVVVSELKVGVSNAGIRYIYSNAQWQNNLTPLTNNTYDLGSSTLKWKTLNGINPGALSLPKGYTEEGADKDYINIASVIQTLDGTLYNYTMPDNGWICVRAEQATQVQVTLSSGWAFGQSIANSTGSTLIVSVPFRKGDIVAIKVRAPTLERARFYPMQGNV